ncbi:MAG: succinylglutamate desuccinylase, partial [Burkholderiales bacterium]
HPFDEAVSRTWLELARIFSDYPIAHSCFATTVELRGDVDVSYALADHDTAAILYFATLEGAISMALPPAEPDAVFATPLAGVLPLSAPVAGIVVFECAVGDWIRRGEIVARLVDPISLDETALTSDIDGVLFARTRTRYAIAGQRLAKIAGRDPIRSGKLLSP